jgi:hypothetical protein
MDTNNEKLLFSDKVFRLVGCAIDEGAAAKRKECSFASRGFAAEDSGRYSFARERERLGNHLE